MARENQGLQIALIIFVMLTLVLGVTTFIFFRQCDEATTETAQAKRDAADNRTAANNFQDENARLKQMAGFRDTDDMQTIEEEFGKDMTTYAGTEPAETRFYRQVLERQYNQLTERAAELDAEKAARATETARNESRDSVVKPQIATHKAAAEKANKDHLDEREKFNADRAGFEKVEAELASSLQRARKEGEATVAQLQENLEKTNIRLHTVSQSNQQKAEKLEKLAKETFEIADGEVTWVNQRNGTVWINLGRGDALNRQTSFSVYASDTNDVTKSGKKGSIEVTQVLGNHVAEARIVEDRISDPIMPGDKVYTPVWTRGEQRRFALAGDFDLNEDGKSDLDTVRNLITMNGGVIDAYIDDNGKKHGKMTINTRYLVLGEAPNARGNANVIESYSKMIGDAKKLGIGSVPLDELLNRMGWKNQTPVVRFGPGANPADFRAKPPAGTNPVSSGNVSGLFRERQPPKASAAGGAF